MDFLSNVSLSAVYISCSSESLNEEAVDLPLETRPTGDLVACLRLSDGQLSGMDVSLRAACELLSMSYGAEVRTPYSTHP